MVEAAHNGQGQEGKPQISAHALTGEGTKTRNKSQETSTDTLGFYIYTHIHRQTHWDSTLTHTYASNGKGRRPWLRQHTTDWDRKTSHRLATRNKRQEMSTDTLGFHTDTHTHIHKQTHWDSTLTHAYISNGKGRRQWLRQHTKDRDRKGSHSFAHTHLPEREHSQLTRDRR